MPHDRNGKDDVIPVELIRETVMPPYHYQQAQNGFGSAGTEQDEETGPTPNRRTATK